MSSVPGLDPAERADLARLLPPPGDPELPVDRHRLLKEAFMQHITEPPVVRPRRVARFAVPAGALAAVGVTLAVVVTGTPLLRSQEVSGPAGPAPSAVSSASGTPAESRASSVPARPAPLPQRAKTVRELMERVARAAENKPQVAVGPNQFVYTRNRQAALDTLQWALDHPEAENLSEAVIGPAEEHETWLPTSEGHDGRLRRPGDDMAWIGTDPNSVYAALPTDPDRFLDTIYKTLRKAEGREDAAAYESIEFILETTIVPPRVSAALYRSVAKLPGITLFPDETDADGRAGFAVGYVDEEGIRRTWLFDPVTLDYLGHRYQDVRKGKGGRVIGISAMLQRGVVATTDERPN